jgi:probable HAF family extracellular repeat protein
VLTDLGPAGDLWAGPRAIDAAGRVVGAATGTDGQRYAALWQGGAPVDLNGLLPADSGWHLVRANGINDAGQIAGAGRINGQVHGYLLTPAATPGLPATGMGRGSAPALPAGGALLAAALLLATGGGARLGHRRPTRRA